MLSNYNLKGSIYNLYNKKDDSQMTLILQIQNTNLIQLNFREMILLGLIIVTQKMFFIKVFSVYTRSSTMIFCYCLWLYMSNSQKRNRRYFPMKLGFEVSTYINK